MAERNPQSTFPARGRGVYLLDDHELVRRGFRHLLEDHGIAVSGESGSAREAGRRIPVLRPELAILDANLPDGAGIEVCKAVRSADPSIRCLILCDTPEENILISSILSNAWGCLSKEDDNTEQLRLVRQALAGGTAFSTGFQSLLARAGTFSPDAAATPLSVLTRHEMKIVIGIAQGLTNRQISQDLGLAEKTVKNVVSSALAKLGLDCRTQAAILVATSLSPATQAASYRNHGSGNLVSDLTTNLQECIREGQVPLDDAIRAQAANALARALTATQAPVDSIANGPQHQRRMDGLNPRRAGPDRRYAGAAGP